MSKIIPGYSSIKLDFNSLAIVDGRYRPHWSCNDAIFHVVFRLHDSIAKEQLKKWRDEKEEIKRGCFPKSKEEVGKMKLFSKLDLFMQNGRGSSYLANKKVASFLIELIIKDEGVKYYIHACCVMPNHVHVIIEPFDPHELDSIVIAWKRYSAHKINEILGRTGKVWANDFFDHIIRSQQSFEGQVDYVIKNPEKAGLINWPWVWTPYGKEEE